MLLASYVFHAGYVTCVCLVCDVFMFPRYKGKEIILYCYVDCSKLWSYIQEEEGRGVVIP